MRVAQELIPRLNETPQPVAVAVGRVVRAMGATERLDACIKAAEVTARYIAVASLASAAATRETAEPPPAVDSFVGNLSFGNFEKAARASASVEWSHPLREQLRLCLQSAKMRKAVAGQRLEAFVKLRNELGHAVTNLDEARARALLESKDPVGGLIDLIDGLGPVLACPLLVVLSQQHRRGRFLAHVAFFAGEGEPIPQELELRDPIFEWETPYLCTAEGLIPLSPGLLYQPRAADGQLVLYLLDGIAPEHLRYKSVADNSMLTRPEGVREIAAWVRLPFGPQFSDALSGRPSLEVITCRDGRTLHAYLSGAGLTPADRGPEAVPETEEGGRQPSETPRMTTLRDFERHANILGLGTAYRDVLYFLAERGAHAELSDSTVRLITRQEPLRVLATLELQPGPILRIALLLGAISAGSGDETEIHNLGPSDLADALVDRIRHLFEHGGRTMSGHP
jgi:hypothetical protein